MPEESAIVVRDVHKSFRLPHEQYSSLKNRLLHIKNRKKGYENQHVLKGVSFEVKKGEFFGIVGRNGSGKSTLLKLMAGVYVQDKGDIKINGTLSPFIELGVGFNAELTGRENVFMNGALLGFSRKQMMEMYDEIVEFAELEKFMDQKLKNYSSGMQVRLAFSIAIRAQGDVLLLDEVLAVGDSAFQKKCNDYFEKLKEVGTTVILVTHGMESVEKFCDRAILIDDGEIKKEGSTSEIAQLYSDINVIDSGKKTAQKNREPVTHVGRNLSLSVRIMDESGNDLDNVRPDNSNILFEVTVKPDADIPDAAMGFSVLNSRNIPIFATNTSVNDVDLSLEKGKTRKVAFEVQNIFSNDIYHIALNIKNKDKTEIYYTNKEIAQFASVGRRHAYAVASPPFNIKVS